MGGVIFAFIADYILAKKYLSITNVRRVFNSICMIGPAIVMFILAFPPAGMECSVASTIGLLCIGMFMNGALTSGHFAAPGDIAPNYAGTIMGLSNTVSGGTMSYSVPVIVGAITYQNQTFGAWTIIFSIATIAYTVTNTLYCFMISGEIQDWNDQVKFKL